MTNDKVKFSDAVKQIKPVGKLTIQPVEEKYELLKAKLKELKLRPYGEWIICGYAIKETTEQGIIKNDNTIGEELKRLDSGVMVLDGGNTEFIIGDKLIVETAKKLAIPTGIKGAAIYLVNPLDIYLVEKIERPVEDLGI
jgi:hypothetical protein